MRFVDINLLELPYGWQKRADRALGKLRQEVVDAELKARNAGEDPAAARKKAITNGLAKPARTKIWRDLSPRLARLRNQKCWYSESLNPTADKDVDHFRPKNQVEGDGTHEGYWWLAFTWRNYRYSSQWCNQRRVDDVNDTSGGKGDQFPLCPNGIRARQEGDDIGLEAPALLDPINDQDWRLLTFLPNGYPTPAMPAGTLEHQRAKTSIEVYHLHCKGLVDGRRSVAATIQLIIQDLEAFHLRIDDLEFRALYLKREVDLLQALGEDAEYSAAALAYARAEIYKLEFGQLVRRDWLQKILGEHE
jgi:hypothetical protein